MESPCTIHTMCTLRHMACAPETVVDKLMVTQVFYKPRLHGATQSSLSWLPWLQERGTVART
jgi:hypothetical protein